MKLLTLVDASVNSHRVLGFTVDVLGPIPGASDLHDTTTQKKT